MLVFKRIEKIIIGLNSVIVVLSLAAMIVLGLLQVILRNIFDSGLVWADVVIRNLVLWVGFSGAVIATSRGRHIAIGALLRIIPQVLRGTVHFIVHIFTSVVCGFLACASLRFVISEKEMGQVLVGRLPLWTTELIIPVTFCFLAYLFLVHAFCDVYLDDF